MKKELFNKKRRNRYVNFCTRAVIFLLFSGCSIAQHEKNPIDYSQYLTQKIEPRDSILVLYTVRQWGINNFGRFAFTPNMYNYTIDDIQYFIAAVFYSPDKLKMIAWIGEKEPNAEIILKYNEDTMVYRICPSGKDTVYNIGAIIGYREDTNSQWLLYELYNRFVPCSSTEESGIEQMSEYYFQNMKKRTNYVTRAYLDSNYGGKVRYDMEKQKLEIGYSYDSLGIDKEYGFNLQDSLFWDKSLVWQKGARVKGFYPFELNGDEPIKMPEINYPTTILKMYSH